MTHTILGQGIILLAAALIVFPSQSASILVPSSAI